MQEGGPGPPGERELAERARRDPEAFVELYRTYVGRIHAFAFRRTGSREAAEDVTSATFERALRSMGGFRWEGGGFGPWLFRIASNQLADHHRSEGRHRTPRGQQAMAVLAGAPHDDPAEAAASVDEGGQEELRRALDALNPRYQQAISLRYLAGLDHAAAAEAMGCTKPVMAVTLHRALAALRRELAPDRREEGRDG